MTQITQKIISIQTVPKLIVSMILLIMEDTQQKSENLIWYCASSNISQH